VRAADAEDQRAQGQAERVEFQGVTCEELSAGDYSVNFLIERTLVADQPALIGAAPKTLKTIVAIDAAVSLATATPFLGALDVPEAVRVGFFSGEGGLSVIQDYARRVVEGRGWNLPDVAGLVFCDTLPQLTSLSHLDALQKFLMDWELRVVFLDPLYLAMPGDEPNNLMKQGKVLRYVNHVCLGCGVTPLLIHHTKRNPADPYSPPELSDLAWSGFSEFAGQWWMIGRREKYRADDPGEHRLWLNIGGRAGHAALHALDIHEGRLSDPEGRGWDVNVLRPSEARAAARDASLASREAAAEERAAKRLEADKARVCRVLAKFPEGDTPNVLRTRAGMSGERFNAALASLLDEGGVVECSIHKQNRRDPYGAYKLAEEETPQG